MATLYEHLNWRVKSWRYARLAPAVLSTPPLVARDDGVELLSMIGTRGLLPYLVAVKSFARALGRGRVVVIDDGSLTDADRSVLRHHLADPEIVAIATIDTGICPRGGTWERLLTILDRRRDAYVVQLDSDTLTLGAVPEVAAAIDAGRSFILRGGADSALMQADAFVAALPGGTDRAHVQHAAERSMAGWRLPGGAMPRYVRGCSGFAGFAPGGDGRSLAEAFSRAMAARLGDALWSRWGSEQVASNVVVANERDPLILPYDRYRNFWDDGLPADRRVMHYIGERRFHRTAYLDDTRRAIAALNA